MLKHYSTKLLLMDLHLYYWDVCHYLYKLNYITSEMFKDLNIESWLNAHGFVWHYCNYNQTTLVIGVDQKSLVTTFIFDTDAKQLVFNGSDNYGSVMLARHRLNEAIEAYNRWALKNHYHNFAYAVSGKFSNDDRYDQTSFIFSYYTAADQILNFLIWLDAYDPTIEVEWR